MKKVSITGTEEIVTKKFIREIISLERGLNYYSAYQGNKVANVIVEFTEIYDGSTKKEIVDAIYDKFDSLIGDYEERMQY